MGDVVSSGRASNRRAVAGLFVALSLLTVGAATARADEQFLREFNVAGLGVDGVAVGPDGYVYTHGWDLDPPVNVNYSVYLGKATLSGTSIRRSGVLGFGEIAARPDGVIGIATGDKVQFANPLLEAAGGILGTSGQFSLPGALAFDATGRAFISTDFADNANGGIVVFDANGSFLYKITSVVVDSPGCGTLRLAPYSMTFAPDGMLWAGYRGSPGLCGTNGFVARLNPNTGEFLGGISGTGEAVIGTPTGLAYANGVLYLSDSSRNDVRAFDPAVPFPTTPLRTVLSQGGGRAPRQLATDCRGRLVIADDARARVIVMGDPADQTPCGPGTFGTPAPPGTTPPGTGGGGTGGTGVDTGASVAYTRIPKGIRTLIRNGATVTVTCLSCTGRAELRAGARVLGSAAVTPGPRGLALVTIRPNRAGRAWLSGRTKLNLTVRVVTATNGQSSAFTKLFKLRRP